MFVIVIKVVRSDHYNIYEHIHLHDPPFVRFLPTPYLQIDACKRKH